VAPDALCEPRTARSARTLVKRYARPAVRAELASGSVGSTLNFGACRSFGMMPSSQSEMSLRARVRCIEPRHQDASLGIAWRIGGLLADATMNRMTPSTREYHLGWWVRCLTSWKRS
jgi:hypothetical protein